MWKGHAVWLVGCAVTLHVVTAQYAVPPTKGKKHRTTTTTTEGPGGFSNEIIGPFPVGDGNTQFGSSPAPAPAPGGGDFWWQGPNSPFKPGSQPSNPPFQPPSNPPFQPPSNPSFQPPPTSGGCGSAGCSGVGTDHRPSPQPSGPGTPIDISQNPFLSSAILGKPLPQSPQGCQGAAGGCQYPGSSNLPGPGQYPGQPQPSVPQSPQGCQGPGGCQYPGGAPNKPGPGQYPGQPQPSGPQNPQGCQGIPGGCQYPGGAPNKPGPGQYPGQPQYLGGPNKSGFDQNPGQGQPQPSVPLRPQCALAGHACVPSSMCIGGTITPHGMLNIRDKQVKECIPGLEACCRIPQESPVGGVAVTPNPGIQKPYTGPLNTTPFPGCAAALKCVTENFCTAEGVMSDTPVFLTREQLENKVPLTDCQNPETGIIGKCCRDPNYKDPWPAGMMMMKTSGDFDDGQYHGENYNPDDNDGFSYNSISSTPYTPTKDHGPKPSNVPAGFNKPFLPPYPSNSPDSGSQTPTGTYKPGFSSVSPYQPQGSFHNPNSIPGSSYEPNQPKPTDVYQPGQPTPGSPYQPGQHNPGSPNQPNQPTPGFPYQPNQPIPGSPYQPSQPTPGSPLQPGQHTPGSPNQPNQPTPGFPYQPNQPTPGSPYQPSQPTPGSPFQPGQHIPGSSNQPNQPTPDSPYQPGQPTPGFPYQPNQPSPDSPYQPGQPTPGSPYQPGQPTPDSLYQPGQPSPGFPYQPNQPSPDSPYQPGQPTPGSPYQPGQPTPSFPYQPGQPTPGSPYQPGQPTPGSTFQPEQPSQGSPFQPGQPSSGSPSNTDKSSSDIPYQQTDYNLPTHPGQNQLPLGQNGLPSGSSCGVRNPGPPGDVAGLEEFPWQALVMSAGNRSLLCGAVIVADNAVLTAAHCVNQLKAGDLLVKAGEWKLLGQNPKPTQVRPVAAIARHPAYDSGSLAKDLAVLILGEVFIFDTNIGKICIPSSLGSEYHQKPGQNCVITGWGKNALSGPVQNAELHKVDVNVIPAKQCEEKLKTSQSFGKYFILNEGFSCALPPSPLDLCKVDYGSAVACAREDGHYEVAGVNSWDIACPTQQPLPTVFATSDAQWLETVLSTPIPVLQEQEQTYHQSLQQGEDTDGVNTEDKPGFSQGYGK